MSNTNYVVVNRTRSKSPARRCTRPTCPELTRHRSQRCPDHRGSKDSPGGRHTSAGSSAPGAGERDSLQFDR
ncbi:hypothetical protein [Rhodococcus sp. ARP2]|uniref:hypothetical protein n=1 Tax=Rhodococcus sp. ARP2 TaxID=1661385 RepID=UPI0011875EE4|nr:hypothetical protein [Rhodococcus sp. ARP2]